MGDNLSLYLSHEAAATDSRDEFLGWPHGVWIKDIRGVINMARENCIEVLTDLEHRYANTVYSWNQ